MKPLYWSSQETKRQGDKLLSWKGCNLILNWGSKALTYLSKMPFPLPLEIAGSINMFSWERLWEQGGVWRGGGLDETAQKDGECHYINRAQVTGHFTDQLPVLKFVKKQRTRREEGRTCRSHYESKLSTSSGALVAAVGCLQRGAGAGRGQFGQALWPRVHPGRGLHLWRLQVEKAAYTRKRWWVRLSTDINFLYKRYWLNAFFFFNYACFSLDCCHFKI